MSVQLFINLIPGIINESHAYEFMQQMKEAIGDFGYSGDVIDDEKQVDIGNLFAKVVKLEINDFLVETVAFLGTPREEDDKTDAKSVMVWTSTVENVEGLLKDLCDHDHLFYCEPVVPYPGEKDCLRTSKPNFLLKDDRLAITLDLPYECSVENRCVVCVMNQPINKPTRIV